MHAASDHDLAERLGRTEPDVPSIRTPLAHEADLQHVQETEATPDVMAAASVELAADDPEPDRGPALERDDGPGFEL